MRRVLNWSGAAAFTLAMVVGAAGASAAARKVTIADVTPPGALAVAGIDDVPAMKAAFDRTGFKSLWEDPAIQKWVQEATKDLAPELKSTLDSLDLKEDDLKWPSGAAGFSAWAVGAGADADLAVLMLADFGEDSQAMHDSVVRALENAQKQNKINLKEGEQDGLEYWTFSFVKPPEDEEGFEDEAMEGAEDMLEQAGLNADALEEMHYARVGAYLLASSRVETLVDTQAQIEGEDRPSVTDNAEFLGARRQVKDAPAYGVVLLQNGREQMKKEIEAQGEQAATLAQAIQMIDTLGLGSITALGVGVRLDTDAGMLEQHFGVLTPAKDGLLALVNPPATKFVPAPFVGADAASVWNLQFDFAGVFPLVNKVIATLPPEQQQEMGGMVMMASASVGPLFANIGPEVSVMSVYDRPFAHDSQKFLAAFKAKDAAALQQAIAALAPMAGLESRDFQGNQIWSPAQGGMLPPDLVALGIGGGWLMMGPGPMVENGMRLAGGADAPKLADEADFKAAVRPLAGQGLGFSFTSFARTMAFQAWMAQNIDKVIEARHAEMFGNEPALDAEEKQWREDALKEMKQAIPGWMRSMPPAEVFTRHIGDTSVEWHSTDEGFVGRGLTLRPSK
ncbi:MAG TPA: hypothetical protein DEB06_01300 [Phycisphaerales bacterium]|nr:hypothetical protein [Phycisphaerales bacterium]